MNAFGIKAWQVGLTPAPWHARVRGRVNHVRQRIADLTYRLIAGREEARRTKVKALNAAIECVLLDHADQLGGIKADPNLAELAYCYWQLTGWIDLGSEPGDGT